jgi:hypothetical protein
VSDKYLDVTASEYLQMDEESKKKILSGCYNKEKRMLVLTKIESYNN